MIKYLLPVWILLCYALPLSAVQATHEAEIVAYAIAAEIQTGQPVFLNLQCGDWTPALMQQLTHILVNQNVDLRLDKSSTEDSEASNNMPNLTEYSLDSALFGAGEPEFEMAGKSAAEFLFLPQRAKPGIQL